jgi:hypothetical protein
MDMMDGVFILLTLGFFALSVGFVIFSDTLMRS